MSITRKAALGLLVISLIAGAISCGNSSNNDQGTSFLALGFFAEDDEGNPDPEIYQSGEIVPLFADSALLTPLQVFDGHLTLARMGLQNRLTTMFIRVTRIDCSYSIAGTVLPIPDDSFNSSVVIGPSPAAEEGVPAAGGDGIPPNNIYIEFEIVSPDVMAYLNANQNSLPQLPFRMIATCTATGVTQAGDALETNPLNYLIQFVDYAECCTGTVGEVPGTTGGGFQTGTGDGGTITFAGNGGGAEGAVLPEAEAAIIADDTIVEE